MKFTHPIRHLIIALTLYAAMAAGAWAEATSLNVRVYNAGPQSFHVNAVLVHGAREALVIDTGFTRADALRIAADVLDSGKTLKTILISNADPDYYFGADTLKAYFPQAQILASAAVRDRIQLKQAGKRAFWAPKMGANAPQHPVIPDVLTDNGLIVDGHAVELRGTEGPLAHRPYVWIPSIRTVAGNIAIFANLHVWTADTQQPLERESWLAQLDEIEALAPHQVIPGHMAPGSSLDLSALVYTRDYLRRFAAEVSNATTAHELIKAMQAAYPSAGLGVALEIGAKVAKGEMKW